MKRTSPRALSPYAQGEADFNNKLGGYYGKPSCNPFSPFTARWADYNRGYNKGWMPVTERNSR